VIVGLDTSVLVRLLTGEPRDLALVALGYFFALPIPFNSPPPSSPPEEGLRRSSSSASMTGSRPQRAAKDSRCGIAPASGCKAAGGLPRPTATAPVADSTLLSPKPITRRLDRNAAPLGSLLCYS